VKQAHAWVLVMNMYQLMETLFPIYRTLMGVGVRKTIEKLTDYGLPLDVHAIPSGTGAFDWTVPDEWELDDAYFGKSIDFREREAVIYSQSFDARISGAEAKKHLHYSEEMPDAVPYVTSYYKRDWGFCVTKAEYEKIRDDDYYRAVIKARFFPGVLSYADLILPGESRHEILFSTYLCHPSMANDNLSGIVVQAELAKWVMSLPERKYTYRFIWCPETIGPIVYISQNEIFAHMSRNIPKHQVPQKVIAGWVLTCLGGPGNFALQHTKWGDTYADKVGAHVLSHLGKNYSSYPWEDRASDERQWVMAGFPVASIQKTKCGTYPEYHTSADNLDFVKPDHLEESLEVYKRIVEVCENDGYYLSNVCCEPFMTKHGLYPTLSKRGSSGSARDYMNVWSYCDGEHSLFQIAQRLKKPFWEVLEIAKELEKHHLLRGGGLARWTKESSMRPGTDTDDLS